MSDMILKKKCRECGEIKALTEFYRQGGRLADGSKRTSLRSECKVCTKDRTRLSNQRARQTAKEELKEIKASLAPDPKVQPKEKRCNKCFKVKPIQTFYKTNHVRKDGTASRRPACSDCENEASKLRQKKRRLAKRGF